MPSEDHFVRSREYFLLSLLMWHPVILAVDSRQVKEKVPLFDSVKKCLPLPLFSSTTYKRRYANRFLLEFLLVIFLIQPYEGAPSFL